MLMRNSAGASLQGIRGKAAIQGGLIDISHGTTAICAGIKVHCRFSAPLPLILLPPGSGRGMPVHEFLAEFLATHGPKIFSAAF
jgi:hypothetical protein